MSIYRYINTQYLAQKRVSPVTIKDFKNGMSHLILSLSLFY
jgi:hypothetical protein